SGPALDSRGNKTFVAHPTVNGDPEFGHFHQAFLRDASNACVILDCSEFGCDVRVVVFHFADPAESLRKIEGFDSDTAGFEKFLAVANGVDRGRASADSADAGVFEFAENGAGSRE